MAVIFVLLILLSLILKKDNIISGIVILFLIFLNYVSPNISDFSNYEYIFHFINEYQKFGMGNGWLYLNEFGRSLNLNYIQFKTILVGIDLILIFSTVYYFSQKSVNLFWGCYLLYPALLDLIQVRFFTALSIVIFSIIFLSKNKFKYYVCFLLLITLATQIHSSTAFFYLLLLTPLIEKKECTFTILIPIFTVVLLFLRGFLKDIVMMFASARQEYYFQTSTTVTTLLIYYIFILVNYEISVYCVNISDTIPDIRSKYLSHFSKNINLLMFVLIPLSLISPEFLRVGRFSWIVLYMACNSIFSSGSTKQSEKYLKISIILLAVISFSVLLLITTPGAIKPFFS